MFKNPFRCKCCETKDAEIDHLRGLVDRVLTQIAPKPIDPGDGIEIIPEDDNEG